MAPSRHDSLSSGIDAGTAKAADSPRWMIEARLSEMYLIAKMEAGQFVTMREMQGVTSNAPVPLDLQPLIDRCCQTGRYWQPSQRPLPPPSLTADEQAWVDQHRVAAGLVDA